MQERFQSPFIVPDLEQLASGGERRKVACAPTGWTSAIEDFAGQGVGTAEPGVGAPSGAMEYTMIRAKEPYTILFSTL